MNNELQIFQNSDFGQIRTMSLNGNPWFVGKDVSDALGYSDTQAMTRRLDKDDLMTDKLSGMNMKSTLINESGLYTAILGSQLPTAKSFKRWVTSEVLPSIRKTGTYSTQPQIPDKQLKAITLQAKATVSTNLCKLYDRAHISPENQIRALSEFFEEEGIRLPDVLHTPYIQQSVKLYSKREIAEKLGVMSRNGNPHVKFISDLLEQLPIRPDEKQFIQRDKYCVDGEINHYTESVIVKVRGWLIEHSYPTKLVLRNGHTCTVVYKEEQS